MLLWLIGVALFVVLWGALWKASPKGGFGVLIGLPIAWILSRLMTPYVTGMNEIPLWVPPLPIALIALALFYFGFRTWLRADNLPPPPASRTTTTAITERRAQLWFGESAFPAARFKRALNTRISFAACWSPRRSATSVPRS